MVGSRLTVPGSSLDKRKFFKTTYRRPIFGRRVAKEVLERLQAEAVELTKIGNRSEATEARSKDLSTLQNITGLATLYDYRRQIPYQDDLVANLLNNLGVKKALGAKENRSFKVCCDAVGEALGDDVMKSLKYMVEYLVKNSKALLYQGFCDLRDGVVLTEAWVKKLMKWDKLDEFLEAERKIWKIKNPKFPEHYATCHCLMYSASMGVSATSATKSAATEVFNTG
ncbi:hypothetical protein M9H77_30271 [Catharanthus roseus]|uniref:Uncharacterized protein n=1 Tax=Catharanthus roseus TaxID=4058 RepID=A0ACB9ZYU1_CATRO|nr:hypothetical protein M9H77_30271 [Catharanthus roseus]